MKNAARIEWDKLGFSYIKTDYRMFPKGQGGPGTWPACSALPLTSAGFQ